MQAPPADPAGSGRQKEETLDTSAEVWRSAQPEIMRMSFRSSSALVVFEYV